MENITPKTVLVSMGKAIAYIQRFATDPDEQPKKATEYELPIKTIMFHGYELMNVYYEDTNGQRKVRNILWTLQKYGYVTSRTIEQTTVIARLGSPNKIKYKQRLWRITEKGLNKLKEIAKKRS